MDKIKISVIIPTYNRDDLLTKCLELIAPGIQTLDISNYEVIVTDDSTNDITKGIIFEKYPWVKWVKGPQKGPASNRNNGAGIALGNWLVFTDDDCLPKEDWLNKYFRAIQDNPNTEAFEGAIFPTNPYELASKDLVACPVNTTGGNFWSANIMVSTNLYFLVKGFDEDYFLAAQEDQQFKIDVEKQTAIVFLKNCIVFHPIKKLSLSKEIIGIKIKAKNYALFLLKNNDLSAKNKLLLYKDEFLFHFRSFVKQILVFKIRVSIISLMWLVYGIVIIFYYTLILKVLKK